METSSATTNAELAEPLLASAQEPEVMMHPGTSTSTVLESGNDNDNGVGGGSSSCDDNNTSGVVVASADTSLESPLLPSTNGDTTSSNDDHDSDFSIQKEMVEMLHLGIPLAISFFCRMVSYIM